MTRPTKTRWAKRIALAAAIAGLALTFINTSWLAGPPRGYVKLIAQRGTAQQVDYAKPARGNCPAATIAPPLHGFLENTVAAINSAKRLGAHAVQVDITPTADGQIALFRDAALDCRTDGHGPARAATLVQLQALDAGYGYSADGGQTFPLRGTGRGQIPSLEQGLAAAGQTALIYNLHSGNPGDAERLIAALNAAGRDPAAHGDGFSGPQAAIARLRAAFPGAWAFSPDELAACTNDYLVFGWLGLTPASCRGGTIVIPLNRQWAFAGWPNRLIQRMDAVGARVIVIGPQASAAPRGLDLPEQLGEIPASFTGYVWVNDMWSVGPALHPADNQRSPREAAELAKALDARRAARD